MLFCANNYHVFIQSSPNSKKVTCLQLYMLSSSRYWLEWKLTYIHMYSRITDRVESMIRFLELGDDCMMTVWQCTSKEQHRYNCVVTCLRDTRYSVQHWRSDAAVMNVATSRNRSPWMNKAEARCSFPIPTRKGSNTAQLNGSLNGQKKITRQQKELFDAERTRELFPAVGIYCDKASIFYDNES